MIMKEEEEENERNDDDEMMIDDDNNYNENGSKRNNNNNDSSSNNNNNNEKKKKVSLNEIYGNKIGIIQSLSMILNAGLMVYAHVGLSAVILSNQQRIEEQNKNSNSNNPISSVPNDSNSTTIIPNYNNNTTNNNNYSIAIELFIPTGACNQNDFYLWYLGDGSKNKSQESNYCAKINNCLINIDCNTNCFNTIFQYTLPCSECFGVIPFCSLQDGCALVCQQNDGVNDECQECTRNCNDIFYKCTGLPEFIDYEYYQISQPPTISPTTTTTTINDDSNNTKETVFSSTLTNDEICTEQQYDLDYKNDIETYYIAYKLAFFTAVNTAWNENARLLAVIVIVFSGIWPYTKNILLMILWYIPYTYQQRNDGLLWLRRLGKYTLVDIYIIFLLIIGVIIQLNLDGVKLFIKGEPRPAIIAFLIATIWEFIHIEWMTYYHYKYEHNKNNNNHNHTIVAKPKSTIVMDTLYFSTTLTRSNSINKSHNDNQKITKFPLLQRLLLLLLLIISITLFIIGSSSEIIRFTSIMASTTDNEEEAAGCIRSYNLYDIAMTYISDYMLTDNTALPGVYTMYIAYILFIIIIPIYVHAVHIITLILNKPIYILIHISDMTWTFASIDVLMLAVFTVQYKFDELIGALAGNEGSQFFTITSKLGTGFYILIAYSVFAGIMQYYFNCIIYEYYNIDPYHKVNYIYTKLFTFCLKDYDDNNNVITSENDDYNDNNNNMDNDNNNNNNIDENKINTNKSNSNDKNNNNSSSDVESAEVSTDDDKQTTISA